MAQFDLLYSFLFITAVLCMYKEQRSQTKLHHVNTQIYSQMTMFNSSRRLPRAHCCFVEIYHFIDSLQTYSNPHCNGAFHFGNTLCFHIHVANIKDNLKDRNCLVYFNFSAEIFED